MEYLSISQVAEKWRLSARRINVLCSEGRILGATKIGSYWAIPEDAEKPADAEWSLREDKRKLRKRSYQWLQSMI